MSKLKEAYWPSPSPMPTREDYLGVSEFYAEQGIRDLYAEKGPAAARELITKFMDELEGRHVQ